MDYVYWANIHANDDDDGSESNNNYSNYESYITRVCYHKFPDTGLLISWCTHCGVKGYYCRITQEYKLNKCDAKNSIGEKANED